MDIKTLEPGYQKLPFKEGILYIPEGNIGGKEPYLAYGRNERISSLNIEYPYIVFLEDLKKIDLGFAVTYKILNEKTKAKRTLKCGLTVTKYPSDGESIPTSTFSKGEYNQIKQHF